MFKKQAIVALVTGSALALTMLSAASSAHASALTPSQVSAVITLLQSFGVDSSTVANVQAVLSGTAPTTGSTAPVSGSVGGQVMPPGQGVGLGCAPGLTANLHRGSEGEDVSRLQSFLAKDPSIFQGPATGFFGPKTEDAVRQWQIAHGIIATDTPMSGGFVGPMTRGEMDREMEQECHNNQSEGSDNSGSTTAQTNSGDN